MRADAERDYHIERARAELDAAYKAAGSPAAKAHFQLCSMHMARARTLLAAARAPQELEWIDRCRPLYEHSLAGAGRG